MRTWFFHHLYALRTALRRLGLTPFSSVTNVAVIAFVLSLPLVVSAILTSLAPITSAVNVNPVVTLFMKETVSFAETENLAKRLQENTNITQLELISKQDALDALRANATWQNALQVLPNNPLPHSIAITLKDDLDITQIHHLTQQWEALDEVDMVQFDRDWLKKLDGILYFFNALLWILAIGVAIIVVATIFNTVRMQALLQRDEITVARLVGATESFVRRPFLYQGAITGFLASCLAIIFSLIGLNMMNGALRLLSESYGQTLNITLPDTFWLIIANLLVMLIAALAARWSVTKHSSF